MFLTFDIGGTKTRMAGSIDGSIFDEPIIQKTPKTFEEFTRMFAKTARVIAGDEKIKMAGGGVSGPFNKEHSMIVNSPNLVALNEKPLKKTMQDVLKCDVVLKNDASVVGLGEAVTGAGKTYDIVAYITVSTGVGGGLIVDKKIARSRFGFEPGHQIININDGSIFTAGLPLSGHAEEYISGAYIEKRYNVKPYEITDENIWDSIARALAVVLNNVAVFWSPDVIVIGGSMVVGDMGRVISYEKTQEYFNNVLKIFAQKPIIKKAELGDIGGLHGGLALIKNYTR